MKLPCPPLRLVCWLTLFFTVVTSQDLPAAVTIMDTFDQGGFSAAPPNTLVQDVDLPFGSRRSSEFFWGGIGSEWTVNAATLDSNTGKLSYVVNGTSTLETRPLGFNLMYSGSQVEHSLQGYSGLILGFSEFSGVGSLFVELGTSLGIQGVQRIDLTGPGEVFFPVSSIYANPGHSVNAFTILHFAFEARSQEFSFTLDEIRLIPEPGAVGFLLTAVAGWLSLRRRRL